MSLSGLFARAVELIGEATILMRHQGGTRQAAFGPQPNIPPARPQGNFPTLKMPTARGWHDGEKPVASAGLKVNAFARGLKHPRWIHVMPNGDVLVAEALFEPSPIKTIFDYAMVSTMRRAAAIGVSPNRIMLLRDSDGDGVAETQTVFLEGLNQPFGMALVGDRFYVGNSDGVIAFPYAAGTSRITAPCSGALSIRNTSSSPREPRPNS
jgi:glucose/arabinose dehydrogenase